MRFSVIMANYNGGKYIGEAIESVLMQDFEDYEFIIIDDGSTDNSREIISSYHERNSSRIKPIFSNINQGQGESFNVGIAAARGELISFLDSDDIWFPEKLRMVDKTFGSMERTVVHQHNLCIVRNGKPTDEPFREAMMVGNYFSHVQRSGGINIPQFVATSGLTFPRSVLEKVGPIPKDFRTCADGYLTRTCFCYGEVMSVNRFWGGYRLHDENLTYQNRSFDSQRYISALLFPALNRFYKKNNISLRFQPLYLKTVAGLHLRPGDRILLLRSARMDYVEELIETLLERFQDIVIDLVVQKSFLNRIDDPRVNQIPISDGPIGRMSFDANFYERTKSKKYVLGIIPYSTPLGEEYGNIHKVLGLLPSCSKMIGIGRNGKSYRLYRLRSFGFRLIPPAVMAWGRELSRIVG
jgi:glycosyltransferase involved in cell wall biosynthesis